MKKTLLIAVFSLLFIGISSAQEIGVRFGNVSGGPVAVDAVFGLGEFSRIHADVSFGDGGVGIDALWDFLYRPLGGEAFNWYLGAGPYVNIDDPFWLGVAAEAGLEYRFNSVPIALGADWRPRLSLIEETDFHWGGFGVNVRFIFGSK
ncbi:MAG: hypothetical protein MUC78_06595 [Bacteroidales bacterium]|jgi:hypothetical protein|nr:hypothetical protein [Bacteroidales bacterium]